MLNNLKNIFKKTKFEAEIKQIGSHKQFGFSKKNEPRN